MAEYYIGVKQVRANPEIKNDKEGYAVEYPDGYKSWSPKEQFEKYYCPMGHLYNPVPNGSDIVYMGENVNKITQKMVDNFIRKIKVSTLGEKTTVVQATLANGFEIVESSSCVDVKNYSEEMGKKICLDRIKNKIWELLGFTLQWAHSGLKRPLVVDPIESNPI